MSVTIRWDGRLMEQKRHQVRQAILRSAVLLHTRARVLASRPARRVTKRRTRATSAGPRGSSYTVYLPSQPGEPPALRTGFGRSSITWWRVEDLTVRVGIRGNGVYMAYLETGTRKIARRPWLSRALDDTRQAIQVLIGEALR